MTRVRHQIPAPKFCADCRAVLVTGHENDPAWHWPGCRLVSKKAAS